MDSAPAQETGSSAERRWVTSLVLPGSPSEDWLRTEQLLGSRAPEGFVIRSPSSLSGSADTAAPVALIAPALYSVWNSALPFSLNDGALWAGRGSNFAVAAGVRAQAGPVRVILAPQFLFQENAPFQTIPYPRRQAPARSEFASPWYGPPESLDLPLRFGTESRREWDLGQSSLTVDLGPLSAGAATENLWWGPGIRNAIVMSNQAAGIPHVFLRSRSGITTRIGVVEGRWILGRLAESEFFDSDAGNDHRSISALVLALRPAAEPNLSLGVTRAVYAPVEEGRVSALAFFDVLRSVGTPSTAPADELVEPGRDQVFSLFGRWVFPTAGFEAYAEWARFEQPTSVRDLLVAPHHSQGYTVGLQWARPTVAASAVRLQAEATYLEPSSSIFQRPVLSSYSSRSVPQGYTHGGQIIGASIGPGASSQWLALDHLSPNWQLGAFSGRVRWNNAALYSAASGFRREDVSLFGGIRGGARIGDLLLSAELITSTRFNYLFQAIPGEGSDYVGIDIPNHTLRLSLGSAVGPD